MADSEEYQLCPSDGNKDSGTPNVMTPELVTSIVKQVEFYFSDANLATDKKLLKQIRKGLNGFVPVKLLTNFRKIRALTKEAEVVAEALQSSSLLQLSEDGKLVRRIAALPDFDPEDIQRRTIVVDHLPPAPTIESMTELFAVFGKVNLVRICSKESKGKLPHWLTATTYSLNNQQHAFVEFCDEDSAVMAVAALHEADEWGSALKVRHLLVAPSDRHGNIAPMPVRRSHPGGAAVFQSSAYSKMPPPSLAARGAHDPRVARGPAEGRWEGGAALSGALFAPNVSHLNKLEKCLSERNRATPPCQHERTSSWSSMPFVKSHSDRASNTSATTIAHHLSHQCPLEAYLFGDSIASGSSGGSGASDSTLNSLSSQPNAPRTPSGAQPLRPALSQLWDRRMLKEHILNNVDGFLDNLLQSCGNSLSPLLPAAAGEDGSDLTTTVSAPLPQQRGSPVLAALTSVIPEVSGAEAGVPSLTSLKSPLSGHHLLPPGLPVSPASPTYRRSGGDGGNAGSHAGSFSSAAGQAAIAPAFTSYDQHSGTGSSGTMTPSVGGSSGARGTPSRWQANNDDVSTLLQHSGGHDSRQRARRGSRHESIPGSPVAPCSPRGRPAAAASTVGPYCPPTAARRLHSSDGGVALAAAQLLEASVVPLSFAAKHGGGSGRSHRPATPPHIGKKDYASWAAATPEYRSGGGQHGGSGSLHRHSFDVGLSPGAAVDNQLVHIAHGPDGGRGFYSPRGSSGFGSPRIERIST